MTAKAIFDTSAFLAIINDEPGAKIAQDNISNALMCTVNMTEVVTFFVRNGYTDQANIKKILNFIKPVAFDEQIAILAGSMVFITKSHGLSLACIFHEQIIF